MEIEHWETSDFLRSFGVGHRRAVDPAQPAEKSVSSDWNTTYTKQTVEVTLHQEMAGSEAWKCPAGFPQEENSR